MSRNGAALFRRVTPASPRLDEAPPLPDAFLRERRYRRKLRIAEADAYLAERTGTYGYRCQRYDAAIDILRTWGLNDSHTVMDVGSGWSEFGARLYSAPMRRARVMGIDPNPYALPPAGEPLGASPPWRGRYIPVDACIDGIDLDRDPLPRDADFIVCLELIEHLAGPYRLLAEVQDRARGVVITTPNPETTDVLGMDRTHRTPISEAALRRRGFQVVRRSFFGGKDDSLLAWWCAEPSFDREAEQRAGRWPARQAGWDE